MSAYRLYVKENTLIYLVRRTISRLSIDRSKESSHFVFPSGNSSVEKLARASLKARIIVRARFHKPR